MVLFLCALSGGIFLKLFLQLFLFKDVSSNEEVEDDIVSEDTFFTFLGVSFLGTTGFFQRAVNLLLFFLSKVAIDPNILNKVYRFII